MRSKLSRVISPERSEGLRILRHFERAQRVEKSFQIIRRKATSITIPDGVTGIGSSVFYNCSSLTSILIPDSVKSIGNSAFYNCSSLAGIIIPDSVKSIGSSAFAYCALISITIPDSVTSIGNNAFSYCNPLVIYCEAASKPSDWTELWNSLSPVVWDCNNNDKDENGYFYAKINGVRYALKDGIATVARQPENITTATIQAKVSYDGREYSVTGIGDSAFYSCDLKSITIPDSVTYIGRRAFAYCGQLTSITIPDGVTDIGDYAFRECTSLESITIPDGVTSIGYFAFYSCGGLTNIIFDGTKEQWEAIGKASDWDYKTGNYIIHCIGGDIAKS